MESPVVQYKKSDYIETKSGNKISRKSVLHGSQHIHVDGKTIIQHGAILRADLASVKIGRYCLIGANSIIRPPHRRIQGGISFCQLTIGEYVCIGENCVVSAASIGSNVLIGKGCIISKRCILKDCCQIADDSVLAADTVVPPFAIFAGNPAMYVGELPESTEAVFKDIAMGYYQCFQPLD